MPLSSEAKKGGQNRPYPAGQGHEGHKLGGGARPSYGGVSGGGQPSGSEFGAADPGANPDPRRGRGRPQTKVPIIMAGQAYESDDLRFRIWCHGMELIGQPRKNRVHPSLHNEKWEAKTQNRWKAERSFAGLQKFRWLVIRYETTSFMYQAFLHLTCLLLTLEHF